MRVQKITTELFEKMISTYEGAQQEARELCLVLEASRDAGRDRRRQLRRLHRHELGYRAKIHTKWVGQSSVVKSIPKVKADLLIDYL